MYKHFIEDIDKLEEFIELYENHKESCQKVRNEIMKIEELKKALYDKYHQKFGVIDTAEVKQYSKFEIDQIRSELLDTSILTILKRFLGIGKKQDVIYAELMGKINGLLLFMQEEEGRQESQVREALDKIRLYGKKIRKRYNEVLRISGYSENALWDRYEGSNEEENLLYFGDIDILVETDVKSSEEVIKEVLGPCYQGGFIRIPYVWTNTEPFQFGFEYQGEKARQRANSLTRSLLYQQIRQMPEYALELHLIDGDNTGNDFSELMGLKQIRESEVWELNTRITHNHYKCGQLYLNAKDISEGLGRLDKYIGDVAEEMAGFQTVEEYNDAQRGREDGKGMIPLQMVVVQNFPKGFNDSDIEILNKLIKNGRQRGVSVLIQYERKDKNLFAGKIDHAAQDLLDIVTLEQDNSHIMTKALSSGIDLKVMEQGKREYIQSLIDEKMKEKTVDNRFSVLIGTKGPFGERKAEEGLHIPFAVDRKGEVKEFTLAKALNAHGLISGGTGSGKSTLLHMIISSVAMSYTPDDVEMWLADYKINEFSSYKYNTPPHIKFLGLSKGQDFTYAFIDRIYGEYERRQQTVKRADEEIKRRGENTNITSIADYRKHFGNESISRLLIIIDEFHVMAQQVNEDLKYKEKLENLLAEGRAMGITFLFSDQAVTVGLKGLTEKGKKQIKCRLAMANDKDEMKEMLQMSGGELPDFVKTMKTGECVLSTIETVRAEDGTFEEKQKTEKVKNIYIDGETRFELCKHIRQFYHMDNYTPVYMDETEVKYYNSAEIDQWERDNLKKVDYSRMKYLFMGEALDLTGCFAVQLLHRRGENIMSVGGTEEQQLSLLLAEVRSMQRVPGHKIVIFADSYNGVFTMYEEKLLSLAEEDCNTRIYDRPEDICEQINVLLKETADRSRDNRTLVIWLGLDEMYEEFQSYPDEKREKYKNAGESREKSRALDSMMDSLDYKWEALFGDSSEKQEDVRSEYRDEEEDLYNASEDVLQLLHAGPRNGVFHYVIYDNTSPIRNNRKIKPEDFKHKLAFAMGRDECAEYLGRSMLLDGMENQENVAAYYDGKGKVKKFVPYRFD